MNLLKNNTIQDSGKLLVILLKISAFFVFIGRAWQHFRWEPPYRSVLWDQSLMEGIINKVFGLTWLEYTHSEAIEQATSAGIFYMGVVYVLFAVASLIISNKAGLVNKIAKAFVLTGALNLVLLAFLFSKDLFLDAGQFFEYAIQIGSPALLWLHFSRFSKQRMKLYMKIAIALTFICHGLYAMGYYPTPGMWVDMVINTFSVSDQKAIEFLKIAGYLDIVFGLLLFVPGVLKPTLAYLVFWGFITTAARIYTNLYLGSISLILEHFLHEVLIRIPHFLMPILLLGMVWKNKTGFVESLKKTFYGETGTEKEAVLMTK